MKLEENILNYGLERTEAQTQGFATPNLLSQLRVCTWGSEQLHVGETRAAESKIKEASNNRDATDFILLQTLSDMQAIGDSQMG